MECNDALDSSDAICECGAGSRVYTGLESGATTQDPEWACSALHNKCEDTEDCDLGAAYYDGVREVDDGDTRCRAFKGHSSCRTASGVCNGDCTTEEEIRACCASTPGCSGYFGNGGDWWTYHGTTCTFENVPTSQGYKACVLFYSTSPAY